MFGVLFRSHFVFVLIVGCICHDSRISPLILHLKMKPYWFWHNFWHHIKVYSSTIPLRPIEIRSVPDTPPCQPCLLLWPTLPFIKVCWCDQYFFRQGNTLSSIFHIFLIKVEIRYFWMTKGIPYFFYDK